MKKINQGASWGGSVNRFLSDVFAISGVRSPRWSASRPRSLRPITALSIVLTGLVGIVAFRHGIANWNLPTVPLMDTGMTISDLYDTIPNIQTCQAGSLKQSEKDKILQRLNQIRTLHHLPPVAYALDQDSFASQSALLSAANTEYPKRIDPSARCWSQLAAANPVNHLGYFVYYPPSTSSASPATDLVQSEHFLAGMLQDGRRGGLAARRWLLNPFLQAIAFSRVDGESQDRKVQIPDRDGQLQETTQNYVSSAAIAIASTPVKQAANTDPYLVAYPFCDYPKALFQKDQYRHGYPLMSVSVVADRNQAENNSSQQVDFASTQVEIKDTKGNVISVQNLQYDYDRYGLGNVLSWSADTIQPGVIYKVAIKNVRLTGNFVNYDYWFRLK